MYSYCGTSQNALLRLFLEEKISVKVSKRTKVFFSHSKFSPLWYLLYDGCTYLYFKSCGKEIEDVWAYIEACICELLSYLSFHRMHSFWYKEGNLGACKRIEWGKANERGVNTETGRSFAVCFISSLFSSFLFTLFSFRCFH